MYRTDKSSLFLFLHHNEFISYYSDCIDTFSEINGNGQLCVDKQKNYEELRAYFLGSNM